MSSMNSSQPNWKMAMLYKAYYTLDAQSCIFPTIGMHISSSEWVIDFHEVFLKVISFSDAFKLCSHTDSRILLHHWTIHHSVNMVPTQSYLHSSQYKAVSCPPTSTFTEIFSAPKYLSFSVRQDLWFQQCSYLLLHLINVPCKFISSLKRELSYNTLHLVGIQKLCKNKQQKVTFFFFEYLKSNFGCSHSF